MLFDTDVLVWFLRGSDQAAQVINPLDDRRLSIVSYMELIEGVRDRADLRTVRNTLVGGRFAVEPLSENIGQRAAVYMEEHRLKSGMHMADALIAATAVERGLPLCTANRKHYSVIADLVIVPFVPRVPRAK